MFLRALRVSCPSLLEAELREIRNIGSVLKYPSHFLDKAFHRARKTFYGTSSSNDFNLNNLLILPFYKHFIPVPGILKCFGINVIFRNNTLKNMLIRNSPVQKGGCIYEIPCNHCNKRYIGQSGKELTTRLKQHQYNVRIGNTASSLFYHMNEYNHTINWKEAKEIMHCNDFVKRNILESCIIKKNCKDLLNTSPGMYRLDDILVNSIFKQLAFK